ncbi:MAG: type II toxin-antitoxin system Phd/YefM family antitoxin [Bifidobacteriaceae bacterium]|jgi:hypothetical protein|nr:type II toxin-antitoxin system Phd/YefM family antitoxin [Bifidobacteriaceae bacterium]
MPTISAQEFNRDVSAAKRAAASGPVFVTNRGRATHVLLTAEDYRARMGPRWVFDALRPSWLEQEGGAVPQDWDAPTRDELPAAADLD